jgi:hypothetical protein
MTMVEKVARAIVIAQFRRQYIGTLKNIGAMIEIDKVWPEFANEARAAIEAMREPTDEMIEAHSYRNHGSIKERTHFAADAIHSCHALIDGALGKTLSAPARTVTGQDGTVHPF